MSKWISVDEQMPRPDILIWIAGIRYNSDEKSVHLGEYNPVRESFVHFDDPDSVSNVTHWMPIEYPDLPSMDTAP